jgi:hypothetical protein
MLSKEGLEIRLVPWHATLIRDIPLVLLIIVLAHFIHAGRAKIAGIKVAKETRVGGQSMEFCDSIRRLLDIFRL